MAHLLEVNNLAVSYHTYQGEVQSVRGVSFFMEEGETVALVGESGCGKSVTAKSLMRLIRENGEIKKESQIQFEGQDILKLKKKELSSYRGEKVSMIFQDALASLNPTMKVGYQITEMLTLHKKMSASDAKAAAIEIMQSVGIPDAKNRFGLYPHSFSGGQRQRIMIGIALACNPKLLIADEPTTALDVTIQDQIMELLRSMQEKNHTAILIITHDLGVVANLAKRVYVMYAGKIVEEGTSQEIFYEPKHPYTWALLKAVPRLDQEGKGKLESIIGTPPDLISPPAGCPFAPRCKYCMNLCRQRDALPTEYSSTHRASCWLYDTRAPQVTPPQFLQKKGGGQNV
ncbi:MAG: ABC transporter ATP-binding protein [bacterium]|nr:ABC transporter ATP-binding protein [bacterium]